MVECAGLENRFTVGASDGTAAVSSQPSESLSPALLSTLEHYPDLPPLIKAWPNLPDDIRNGIIAIVRGATA